MKNLEAMNAALFCLAICFSLFPVWSDHCHCHHLPLHCRRCPRSLRPRPMMAFDPRQKAEMAEQQEGYQIDLGNLMAFDSQHQFQPILDKSKWGLAKLVVQMQVDFSQGRAAMALYRGVSYFLAHDGCSMVKVCAEFGMLLLDVMMCSSGFHFAARIIGKGNNGSFDDLCL